MNKNSTVTDMSPVVEGLLRIHKIISRGLSISIRKCDKYLVKQNIPSGEITGFSMYLSSLKWVTHAHHLSEDDIVFPCFKDLIEAPYNLLKDDHNAMGPHIGLTGPVSSGDTSDQSGQASGGSERI
ncbi:MAG TPA: hypothetical protein DDW27_13630 [Bacteroidales bacterium]|nr:hypothetical protein [Bacteroidales bacterium]